MGPEVLARNAFGTQCSAVMEPAPFTEEMNSAFHSASFGMTASASEDAIRPSRMFTRSRSTISCALRRQFAGTPCVSSKRNSTGRPSRPPSAFTVRAQRRQVRTTCAPRTAQVPVMAVGTPMRIGPLCAAAGRINAGAANKPSAARRPIVR